MGRDKKICLGVEKMKFVKFLILIIGIVSITATKLSHRSQFEAFKQQFGKAYIDEVEELERFRIFENTLQEIEDHNRAGKGWKKGLNHLWLLPRMSTLGTCLTQLIGGTKEQSVK